MTPEEKAIEPVEEYKGIINKYAIVLGEHNQKLAVECSKIAVKAILASKPIANSIDYYLDVLNELKKLQTTNKF